MTDLDTLRRALRASPPPEPTFDPAAVIARGRRLRWRRRAAAAGGGLCLGVAVFGAVAGVGRADRAVTAARSSHDLPGQPAGPAPRQRRHPAATSAVARPRRPHAVAIGHGVAHRHPDHPGERHPDDPRERHPNADANGNGDNRAEPAGADDVGPGGDPERQREQRRPDDDHAQRRRHRRVGRSTERHAHRDPIITCGRS